ncbi:FAD:protein FMN transferase [Clostridium sp. SYSU_GA19001]|uniref:FAD:protein FMN transferase n=1 Tax=Clostridium caldaquaticum TaxID=2940653 RepID=UPI00207775F2|nr:FAD:protein FMN transferase [Clostridium caldaquaticum]MCM8710346.1 FAD:protein FMN transferase [Clostridium caldaquaticum]
MKIINKKNIFFLLSVIITSFSVLFGCQKNTQPVSKTQIILGTSCTIKLYDNISDETFEKVFNRLKEIEDKMSINKDKSEVIDINSAAGKDYVKVSDDTFEVIKKGIYYSSLYNKFDITIGPLVKLWNISFDNAVNARIPEDKEIKDRLPLVDYNKVLLNESESKIMLKEKGMMIDLGGIAKGYAADEAVRILKERGVQHAIVNLGGNVMTLGGRPDGSSWTIGVQHPFDDRGNYVGTVRVSDKTVVTSGIYERYIKVNDKIYHHILDKNTGYPVDNELLSVTIITDKSIDGDGLSKIFALGVEKGMELIKTLKGVDAIFITKDNKIYISPSLKGNFQLTDNSFKLIE